jgi:MOSC domain-containing protein YiiM
MGRIEAICVSVRKGVKKTAQPSAWFVAGHGIDGDAHAGPWHRQVSLLSADDVERMRQRGLRDVKPGDFAENLVVSGVNLGALGLGSRLRLGAHTDLNVTQIGKVCHQRCAIYYQTGDCIMPRLGVFARVVHDGRVVAGDGVDVLDVVPRNNLQAVILTIRDRCSPRETSGRSAAALERLLTNILGAHVYASEALPDDRDLIAARLRHYGHGHSIDLVVVVGRSRPVAPGLTAGADRPATLLNGAFILDVPGSEHRAVAALLSSLPALRSLQTRGTTAA